MSVISVGNGAHLYYEDTGSMSGLYTTIVIVHGTAVHSAIFHRLLPYAKANGLRLVLVNRRDYPVSSPLTDEELDPIRPPNSNRETQTAFIRARGLEIAQFLAGFVRKYNIPRVGHVGDKKVGGLAVIAWSSGNGTLLALFGNLDGVPEATRDFLEPYMSAYIHFDGPRWTLGLPHMEPFPRPVSNLTLSEEERFARFKPWVSAYYQHPYLTRPSYFSHSEHSELTGEMLADPPADKRATFDKMTLEEQDSTTSRYALFHSEVLMRVADPDVFRRNVRRALFGEDEALVVWKNMRVVFFQCSESLWEMISALWVIEREYTQKQEEGDKRGRKIEFNLWRGANHVPMWDQPEETMKKFAELVDGSSAPRMPARL